MDKELREEEIEYGGLEARIRPLSKECSEEEECRLAAITAEFEKKLLEDSDAERLPKSLHIKKNVKEIRKKKKKLAKEVVKKKS